MKTKQLLLSLLAFLLPLTSWSAVWQDPVSKVNYEYTVGTNEASVKAGYWWDPGSPNVNRNVTILSSFTVDDKEYTVTSLGNDAFWGLYITDVIIPSSVKYIGQEAFYYCSELVNLNFNLICND